jgi:citrate lyase subunit beta/citryl-CoA lyase
MQNGAGAVRLRRSVLYAPASNSRALEKARSLACDGVILDLEDSVAEEQKDAARAAALEALASGYEARETVLRCNALETPWGRSDLAAAVVSGPHAVLIPKVRTAGDVLAVERELEAAPAHTRIWAMIETAQGVLNLTEIAATSTRTRLAGFVAGPNDLAVELGHRGGADRAWISPVLSQIVVAAKAFGLTALAGTYNDFEDETGLERECREEAAFGFDGKTLIHPRQIETANQAFSPTPEELDWARAVIEAFAAPEAKGRGAIRLQGRMVERLHLKDAERILALSRGPAGP